MAKINVNEIQPGMTLAGDVLNNDNHILLRAGSIITEKHKTIFQSWGVVEIDINIDVDADMEKKSHGDLSGNQDRQVNSVVKEEAEKKTRELFRHANVEHPVMTELFRLSSARYLELKGDSYENKPAVAD